jgi:chromatin remodeling complex protein RSC6
MKENCDTLDETHKQIETKFDSLSSSIESLNERQEKESIPKKQEKESAAEKQKGHFEKDDPQLGKLINKFETQGQQMQCQFRFSDTGSLGYDSMPGSFSTTNDRTRSERPYFIFQAGRGVKQNNKQRETLQEEERCDV